jgi:hypothetical protein
VAAPTTIACRLVDVELEVAAVHEAEHPRGRPRQALVPVDEAATFSGNEGYALARNAPDEIGARAR